MDVKNMEIDIKIYIKNIDIANFEYRYKKY